VVVSVRVTVVVPETHPSTLAVISLLDASGVYCLRPFDAAVRTDRPSDEEELVVDDEPEVTDAHAPRLRQQYNEVRTSYGGAEALAEIDETIDVVLLDRRMPLSGAVARNR
jgi:hypothetical protein